MRLLAMPPLLLLALSVAAGVQETGKQPLTPAEQYQALEKEYQDALQTYSKEYREAKTPAERQKVRQEKYPRPGKFVDRFLDLAAKNPKEPFAFDALLRAFRLGGGSLAQTQRNRAKVLAQVCRDHLNNPKLAQSLALLTSSTDEASFDLLKQVLANNKQAQVQGQACLALARLLRQEAQMVQILKDQPEQAKMLVARLGKEKVKRLSEANVASLEKEAEGFLERVVKEFANIKDARRGTLGSVAESELFELRNLSIGKIAPNIEGEDIEGKPFKLSDYRGKVVVLDFWGHW
jgi:hypothetical protein